MERGNDTLSQVTNKLSGTEGKWGWHFSYEVYGVASSAFVVDRTSTPSNTDQGQRGMQSPKLVAGIHKFHHAYGVSNL